MIRGFEESLLFFNASKSLYSSINTAKPSNSVLGEAILGAPAGTAVWVEVLPVGVEPGLVEEPLPPLEDPPPVELSSGTRLESVTDLARSL